MIFRPLLTIVAATCAFAHLSANEGKVIFTENFDGDLFSDNATLIAAGESSDVWRFNNLRNGVVITTSEVALSPPRAAALQVSGGGDQAQVLTNFPPGTDEISTPIALKFAFFCRGLEVPAYFMVRDEGGETLALVTINKGGLIQAAFENTGGRIVNLGSVIAGQWYSLLLQLPAASAQDKVYEATLFESDGESVIGTASGFLFSDQPSGNYSYFSVMLGAPEEDLPASILALDNLTITALSP